MAKSWKDALLGTGLPLEHDVKKYLESRDCIARFEYSYLKPDELRLEKQFSYDVDASLIRPPHFVNLMVECKYRHPAVRWIFTPDDYGGPDELYPNAFLHPFDHFVRGTFPFAGSFPRQLAPCCSKGVELTPDGANDKSITQALSQLAFAFAPHVADAIEHQARRLLGSEFIFYHVPVIATTAQLFRLRDGVTLDSIRGASEVEDVATEEDCLVLKYQAGVELRQHNLGVLQAAGSSLGGEALKASLSTFTDDFGHLFSVLADQSPEAVVIISVRNNWGAFDHFLRYVEEILKPSEALVAEVRAQEAALRATVEALGLLARRPEAKGEP